MFRVSPDLEVAKTVNEFRDSGSISNLKLFTIASIGAIILCSFAIFNGYAVFFNDSRSYVRGGSAVATKVFGAQIDDGAWKSRASIASSIDSSVSLSSIGKSVPKAVTGNRSIYYGLLAFFGYRISNFWLTIFIQSFAVSSVIAIAWLRGLNFQVSSYFVVMLFLAVLTDSGVFVAYIMPDIFTAVLILIAAVVVGFWERIRAAEKLFLFATGAYASCTHPSHLPILAAVIALVAIYYVAHRTRFRRGWAVLLLVGCEVVGISATLAFNIVVTKLTGERPLLLPHITAHLVEMGPGTRYIRANCPGAGFAVCQFAPRLPVGWVTFLSSTDPKTGVFEVASPSVQRLLSDEQTRFAEAVLLFDPVGVIAGTARDVARQAVLFNLDTLKLSTPARENYYDSFPPKVYRHIVTSRVGRNDITLDSISRIDLLVVGISVLGLMCFAITCIYYESESVVFSDAKVFAAVIVVGVLANALICGALASPEPRFQARVVWLIPLAFATLLHASRSIAARRRHMSSPL